MTKLRNGFTTGSCAAACALASCLWQAEGEMPESVSVILPDGSQYRPAVHALAPYRCAVYKDAGDDPDITDGCEVWAEVKLSGHDGALCFRAGDGVGTITRPGLKLSPGEPAINPVPRQMIEQAVRSIIGRMAAEITIGITDGQILAAKTFNPRLGIEGGLSILGTTGIVHPMSDEAITETIRLELQMHRTAGADTVALVFGSQGETAVNQLRPGLPCVQISNFVGFASDTACELGFLRMLLAGQPGKLVKVAGGCMQTHSRYGDGRRETLCARLALMGAPVPLLAQVMESVTLDGLISVITDSGYSPVWSSLCQAASVYLHARTHDRILIDTMMLDSSGQIIGEYHDT